METMLTTITLTTKPWVNVIDEDIHIPKSRNPMRPSRNNHRLPACTSAWKLSQASKLPNLQKNLIQETRSKLFSFW